MSTFYSLIILKVLDAKRKGKSAFHAGVQVAHILANVFPKDQCMLHVDGAHSVEKANEHARRDQLAHAELKKLESVVDRVEERAQSGKKTSKATWMEIERRIRRTFRLTEEDKAMFQRGLETRFSVCRCTSETDLCIARLPPRDGRRIAITADSDLLAFENVTEILRPLPHSKGYGLYSREEVLEAFGFSSSSQLVALACVSANDYGKNIPGFGIKTNIGIIKGLASAQSVPEVIERYLHEVCTRTGKSVTMEEFTTRTMIYHHNTDSVIQESLLLSGVPGNMIHDTEMSLIADAEEPTLTALDHTIDEDVPNDMNTSLVSMPVSVRQTLDPHLGGLLDRLNRSKETLRNLVAKSRTTRSDRPFYVANGSTMNQYRPVFSSESAILSGKRYSDITQAKPKHCDPPKIRAKNDTSPITKEKKKKKKKKKKQEGKRKQGGGTGPPRKLNQSTIFDHELRKTHPVKSLTIGSAAANMKRKGLTENEAKAMQDQLKVGTDLANQLQLRAYYACAITITHLLDEESLAPLLSSTTPGTDISETRRTIFNHMLDSQTFMFALGRLLFLGEPVYKKESTWKLGDPRCPLPSESAQMVYNLFQENTGLLPLKTNPAMSQIAITRLSEMSMIPVQAAIRSHYRNCDFEIEKNKEMNDIEFFFLHNGTSKTYADFPKAALRPGFVNFSETVLIDIFWANKDTKAILQARLREDDVGDTKQSVKQFVQDHKARLVDKLFGHNGYNNASLQEQTDKPTKLKLKGTVCTNGLVLHVLAYDTSVLRPKAAREKASREDEDDMDSNDFDGMDVDDPFIDPDDFEIEDDDTEVKPGDNHPQSASTAQDTYKGLTINWKQGSSLLTNVEVQFDHPDKCPSPDTIVIGIDPGVVNAVTAAVIDPHRPNSRQVVKIKKSFLYSPYVKFRSALETQKRELGITQLEHDIPAFSRETLKEYLSYMTKPSGQFPTVLARIMDFYKGSWYLKKSWDCRKATTACLDLAIKGILRMAEINEGQKKNQKRRQVVFCIGLGSFDARKGLPSKHTILLTRLITRVKSIGYVVVGAHEFFTSAKCPRPGCTAFVFGKGNRSKHCPSCHQFFDRDAIGSENLARVCQGQLQNQKRPDKYKPERPDPSVQEQGPSTPERKKRHTDLDIPPARRSPRLAKVLEV